jgi:hypothetical protein
MALKISNGIRQVAWLAPDQQVNMISHDHIGVDDQPFILHAISKAINDNISIHLS